MEWPVPLSDISSKGIKKTALWKRTIIRVLNYEYWPFYVFYLPAFLYYLWLSVKRGSFFFFSAANPRIETGGMLGESKWEVFQLIPAKYYPATSKISVPCSTGDVLAAMDKADLKFPVILKPDIGERGRMVEKINDQVHLERYLSKIRVDFLLQKFIDYPLELGIFYVRHPDWDRGRITSIVRKGFLTVTGDGEKRIIDLLRENVRAQLQFDFSSGFYQDRLQDIPKINEEIIVESIGNHCRGTIFYNDHHQIDDRLEAVIDEVARQIPDFYFGRFDLKARSYGDLREGKNFSILELNGAGSEPGHIYDPNFSFWKAQRDIFHHLYLLSEISAGNRGKGHAYMSFREGMDKISEIRRYKMT